MQTTRSKILVVDDVPTNRALLSDLLSDKYDIIEASNGNEALLILQEKMTEISLMLLDMVMPERDGMEVLAVMNKNGWINEIPVIMISAERSPSLIEGAYSLGVTDFINRPFDQMVVQNRVRNTIHLYSKQRKLSDLVASQIYEKTRNNNMLVTVLSHIVEFRNGESGMHVLHISTITELLLRSLLARTSRYSFPERDISLISTASSMHDIGKITIPDEILNKPGKFTPEEFDIMKHHSMNGASMLQGVPFSKDEPLMKFAYEICRWHHERWDGHGYPDGLKGDDIPIAAQIVSIADVYDALTSDRCYKKAYSHEKALEMIYNNECGVFNPLLLDSLSDVSDLLNKELKAHSWIQQADKDFAKIANTMSDDSEHPIYTQTFRQFSYERQKSLFFESMLKGATFEYTYNPSVLRFTGKGKLKLELPETITDPENNEILAGIIPAETRNRFWALLNSSSTKESPINMDGIIIIDNVKKSCKFQAQVIWSSPEDIDDIPIAAYGQISLIP